MALTEPCVLPFQILLDDHLQFSRAEIRIRAQIIIPQFFPDKEIILKISESMLQNCFPNSMYPGLRCRNQQFPSYTVSPNSHSILNYKTVPRAQYYHKPVLDKALDREEQPEIRLTLTALDGEIPPRSTGLIFADRHRDNAPEFV